MKNQVIATQNNLLFAQMIARRRRMIEWREKAIKFHEAINKEQQAKALVLKLITVNQMLINLIEENQELAYSQLYSKQVKFYANNLQSELIKRVNTLGWNNTQEMKDSVQELTDMSGLLESMLEKVFTIPRHLQKDLDTDIEKLFDHYDLLAFIDELGWMKKERITFTASFIKGTIQVLRVNEEKKELIVEITNDKGITHTEHWNLTDTLELYRSKQIII